MLNGIRRQCLIPDDKIFHFERAKELISLVWFSDGHTGDAVIRELVGNDCPFFALHSVDVEP